MTQQAEIMLRVGACDTSVEIITTEATHLIRKSAIHSMVELDEIVGGHHKIELHYGNTSIQFLIDITEIKMFDLDEIFGLRDWPSFEGGLGNADAEYRQQVEELKAEVASSA